MALSVKQDPNPTMYHSKYRGWELQNEHGDMVCTFFGPMSFMMAMAALKLYNDGFRMADAQDVYLPYRVVPKDDEYLERD